MLNKLKRTILLLVMPFFLLTGLSLTGCQDSPEKNQNINSYLTEIKEWQQNRVNSLIKPTGWLSLAGLFPLKEGENTIGSDSANQIIFPVNAPPFMGSITLDKSEIELRVKQNVEILVNENPVRQINLQSDENGAPTVMSHGSLSWFVIKRGEYYFIRLRDSENPNLTNFDGIERFPVNPDWRIKAKFIEYNPAKKILIPNVLGTVNEELAAGKLVFQIEGKEYWLDPIGEPGDENWFLIFADATNGFETYGAGRFLYVPKPDRNGNTIIDFNKAYNPPCAFTPFATCPLPPEQNHLPIKITAGEKNYGKSNFH